MVASPVIFEAQCRTPRQMNLVNAICRYLEMAENHALATSLMVVSEIAFASLARRPQLVDRAPNEAAPVAGARGCVGPGNPKRELDAKAESDLRAKKIAAVVFDSPGGSVVGGYDLAHVIRRFMQIAPGPPPLSATP